MISDPLLSLTQAFQLMGIIQCLLLMAYLVGCGGDVRRRLLAAGFFLALAAGFGLPLWPSDWPGWIPSLLAAIAGALPALSYLLAGQMLAARFPDWRQFAILLVPLVGAPLLFIGDLAPGSEVCLAAGLCVEANASARLWQVISGAGVLLAMIAYVELHIRTVLERPQSSERRGLALGLVIVNLAVLGAVLAELFGFISPEEAEFTLITLGLGFIYIATSMMFRIFPESSQFALHGAEPARPELAPSKPIDSSVEVLEMSGEELELLARVQRYLVEEQPHFKEDFHRGDMARALDVPEHRLSRVVNQGFGKSLIDVLNELRVEEAKNLLLSTDQQITQIAFASGFNALPSFHRVFKKHAGCSPSEWREKNMGIGGKSPLKS